MTMAPHTLIELRNDGPLSKDERRILQFGSREKAERAQRDAVVRYHKREAERAARILASLQGCDPARAGWEQTLTRHLNAWRDLVNAGVQMAAE